MGMVLTGWGLRRLDCSGCVASSSFVTLRSTRKTTGIRRRRTIKYNINLRVNVGRCQWRCNEMVGGAEQIELLERFHIVPNLPIPTYITAASRKVARPTSHLNKSTPSVPTPHSQTSARG